MDFIKQSKRRSLNKRYYCRFPGESEEDFESTLRLVRHCEYHGLYIFKYSERKGTPSAKMFDGVSDADKSARFTALENMQKKIQGEVYSTYIGRQLDVLVEGLSAKSSDAVTGHSSCHKVIIFRGGADLFGRIVSVLVTEVKANSLSGELAGQ